MRKVRDLLVRLLKFLYITPVRDAFFNLKSLSPGMRVVAGLGYLSLVVILLVMVAAAIWGKGWKVVTYGEVDAQIQVPVVVTGVAMAGLLGSWAYILTGATDSSPFIFLPLSLLFCGLLGYFGVMGSLTYVWLCTLLPLVGAVSVAHLATHKKPFWKKYPLLEFLFWFVVTVLAILLTWLGSDKAAGLGSQVAGIFSPFFLLLYPIFLLSALSIVDLAVDISSWVVAQLHKLLPDPALQGLVAFALVSRLAGAPLMFVLNPDIVRLAQNPSLDLQDVLLPAAMVTDTFFSWPLIIAGLVLAFSKRWNAYNCAKLLTLCFVSPIFSLGMILALGRRGDISNPLEMTINSLGVFPSVAVFVVMLTYNVLGQGARFARTDGKLLPRPARILLALGLALLVASLATFRVNLLETASLQPWNDFTDIFGNIFLMGIFFLGVPYLVWLTWKRPWRLAGDAAEFAAARPRLGFLSGISPRIWLVVGLVAAMGFCLISSILSLIFVYLSGAPKF